MGNNNCASRRIKKPSAFSLTKQTPHMPITESKIQPPSQQLPSSVFSPCAQSYSIKNITCKKSLTFSHAPLTNSDYLSNKFYHDSARPDEINLEWQIKHVQVVGTVVGNSGLRLDIGVINRVRVRLWVVGGGREKKNITGLVFEIGNYQFVEEILINQTTQTQQIRSVNLKLPKPSAKSQLRIIIESISDPTQSLYLINTYTIPHQSASTEPPTSLPLQKQQLLWNSLAFQLENIYNQSQEVFHSEPLQEQEGDKNGTKLACVICQEEDASCIMLPCRHMCLGRKCMGNFKKIYKLCPLCKKQYEQIIVYRELNKN